MKPRQKLDGRRIDWLVALSSVTVFAVVATMASLEKALAAGVTFGAFATVVSLKWESRHDPRFWALLLFFGVIHTVVIVAINIPEVPFGAMSIPFAIIDALIIWWTLNWLERRFPRRHDR